MEEAKSIDKLAAAMAKAQLEFKTAVFDKRAVYGPYASFKSVREASVEALSRNGLCVLQPIHFDGQNYYLETIIAHSSGQTLSSKIKLMIDRQNMQGLGSAITYAKRYALASLIGVVSDDDDDAQSVSGLKQDAKPDLNTVNKRAPTQATPMAQETPMMPTQEAQQEAPLDFGPAVEDWRNYVVDFSTKWKGRTLAEMGLHEVMSFMEYLMRESKRKNEPLSGKAEVFVKMAQAFARDQAEQAQKADPNNPPDWVNEPFPF